MKEVTSFEERLLDFEAVNTLIHSAFGNVFVIVFFQTGIQPKTNFKISSVNFKEKFDKDLPLVKAGCDHLSPFRLYSGWKN